jgi:hypothetical protein
MGPKFKGPKLPPLSPVPEPPPSGKRTLESSILNIFKNVDLIFDIGYVYVPVIIHTDPDPASSDNK